MLVTERLILRQWEDADREPWAALNADPEVREYFPFVLSRKESDESLDLFRRMIEEQGWGFWAAATKDTGQFIGLIGIAQVNFDAPFTPATEIGWRLAKQHWGKGYATEGARAALDYAFSELHLAEVVAFTAEGNAKSRRVMERLGMTHNACDDFMHPKLPEGHPLQKHVLYRIRNAATVG
ncbi:MAG: GNAT family N-acetyltransferase [Chlamydiia bacterium]|nr:GNAT family N-acetyltransferase [Chlamydiia bacterium]